ncbi:MAG: phosphoribosylformylglycinamidine synthase subunit PurQ [Planctomycetota bacterium]
MHEDPSETRPLALLIRTAGTNCDEELERAFELAGARTSLVHLDTLIREPARLGDAAIIALPGGFSYGDDIASGRILAMKLREQLGEPLRAAAARGALIIGICNGFQALVQAGLLPDPVHGRRTTALVLNKSGSFIDRWAEMRVERGCPCVWTRGLAERWGGRVGGRGSGPASRDPSPSLMTFPVAHAEGRFVATPDTLAVLQEQMLIPLRYASSVNGSIDQIAALTDPTGRIFGLMPHPERFLDWNRHPFWTRLSPEIRSGPTPGLQLFQNAVDAAKRAAAPSPSVPS